MLNRRSALALASAALALPSQALARTFKNVAWDDLIPPGVPYSQIIGEGEIDLINDTWNPVYDLNATRLNQNLDGALVRMPGFIVPLDLQAVGVKDFILVPYVGACVHTPPPPANQLIMVNAKEYWPGHRLWDPVWVSGIMRTQLQSTNLGQTGYSIAAEVMEAYEW